MNYHIVTRIIKTLSLNGLECFENDVKEKIKLGWKPLGGVSMSEKGEQITLAQAMIKEE